jgi:phosphoribosyl-AMP cyclohydrolase
MGAPGETPVSLSFVETEKVFDPRHIYGDAPNPTTL